MKPNRALLILDHGSRQESANEEFRQLAERLRTLRPDLIVEYAHMEVADPDMAAGVAACVARGAKEIVVHPYLLAAGRHTRETIPSLVEQVSQEYPDLQFTITAPLGPHEKLVELVLLRLDELNPS